MPTPTRRAAAALAALAVPAAALAALLPATAAQAATAATGCAYNQVRIAFFDGGGTICQGPGWGFYGIETPPVHEICTGSRAIASVNSISGHQSLSVHQCVTFERSLDNPVSVSVTWVP